MNIYFYRKTTNRITATPVVTLCQFGHSQTAKEYFSKIHQLEIDKKYNRKELLKKHFQATNS